MNQSDEKAWESCSWEGNRRNQIQYALGMSVAQRMEALEGLADVCHHFQWMRENGKFKQQNKNQTTS